MAAGGPLFDRSVDEAFFDPAKLKGAVRHGCQAAVIAPLLIVIAAVAPLWTGAMAATSDPVPNHISLPDVPGWTRVDYRPSYPWKPHFAGADHELLGRYRTGEGLEADIAIAGYARPGEGRELVGFGQGAVAQGSEWAWAASDPAPHHAKDRPSAASGT